MGRNGLKLFLSYASPDKRLAESIQLALLGAGHHVFFDEASLPPAGDYNSRIREAINDSDLFIFLISPNSVRPGRYVQTELQLAKIKWPKPWGVVLPVMIAPTEHELIDPYLAAVTILTPRGSVPAEVAAEVLRLRTSLGASPSITESEKALVEWPKFRASPGLEIIQRLKRENWQFESIIISIFSTIFVLMIVCLTCAFGPIYLGNWPEEHWSSTLRSMIVTGAAVASLFGTFGSFLRSLIDVYKSFINKKDEKYSFRSLIIDYGLRPIFGAIAGNVAFFIAASLSYLANTDIVVNLVLNENENWQSFSNLLYQLSPRTAPQFASCILITFFAGYFSIDLIKLSKSQNAEERKREEEERRQAEERRNFQEEQKRTEAERKPAEEHKDGEHIFLPIWPMRHGKPTSAAAGQPNDQNYAGKTQPLGVVASTCVIRDTIHFLVARNGDIVGGADAMRRIAISLVNSEWGGKFHIRHEYYEETLHALNELLAMAQLSDEQAKQAEQLQALQRHLATSIRTLELALRLTFSGLKSRERFWGVPLSNARVVGFIENLLVEMAMPAPPSARSVNCQLYVPMDSPVWAEVRFSEDEASAYTESWIQELQRHKKIPWTMWNWGQLIPVWKFDDDFIATRLLPPIAVELVRRVSDEENQSSEIYLSRLASMFSKSERNPMSPYSWIVAVRSKRRIKDLALIASPPANRYELLKI